MRHKLKQIFYFLVVVILTALTTICFIIMSSKKLLFYPTTKITFFSMTGFILSKQLLDIARTHTESRLNTKQVLGFWLTFSATIFALDLLLYYGVTDATSCGFVTLILLSLAFFLLSLIDRYQYSLNGAYLYGSLVSSILTRHTTIMTISLSILTLLLAYRWYLRGQ